MLTQVEALVAHVDNQRVLRETVAVQVVQQAGDGLVHREQGAQVVLHIPAPAQHCHVALRLHLAGAERLHELARAGGKELIIHLLGAGVHVVRIPAEIILGGELRLVGIPVEVIGHAAGVLEHSVLHHVAQRPLRHNLLHHIEGNLMLHQVVVIPVAHIPQHALAVVAHELGAVRVVIHQRVGRRQLRHILLHSFQVARGRNPVAVRGLVAHNQRKGLALVAVLHPVDGLCRHQVGHIAAVLVVRGAAIHPRLVEGRVPVVTLAREHLPRVKTRRLRDKMPLAHNTRLVSGSLQHLRVSRLRAVECGATVVIQETVVVRVATRQHARAGRSAQRIRAVRAVKHHTLICQSAKTGHRHRRVSVAAAQHLRRVVICNNEQQVRPSICTHGGAHAEHGGHCCKNGTQLHNSGILAEELPCVNPRNSHCLLGEGTEALSSICQ